jgi:hypothetical protein
MQEPKESRFDVLLRKANPKAFAMVFAFGLLLTGAAMIFQGIKDEGAIDIKAAFITGQVKSGFVGVLLIFGSIIVCVATLHYRVKELATQKRSTIQTIKCRKGDVELEWRGPLDYWTEAEHVERLLGHIAGEIMAPHTPQITPARMDNESNPIGTS